MYNKHKNSLKAVLGQASREAILSKTKLTSLTAILSTARFSSSPLFLNCGWNVVGIILLI